MNDPDRIKRIVQNVITLPTLPTVAAKVMELVGESPSSSSYLKKIIASDQVLTARLLKLANSSYYGFPRKISTVNLAIVFLGFDMLRDLGISVSVINPFSSENGNGYFDYSCFWEHSIGCGIAAKMLARKYQYQIIGEAFVAGLLHDLGKLVLNQCFREEFERVVKLVRTRRIPFNQAEKQVLGVDHAQVGGWLADRWNLPYQLVESLACHHHPERARKNPKLTALVYFSDMLCHKGHIGFSGDEGIPELCPEVTEILSLKQNGQMEKNYATDVKKLHEEIEKSDTFINLVRAEKLGESLEEKTCYT